MINVIRCDVFLYYTNNLFPYYLKFVNYFHATQNQGRFKYQVQI